MAIGNNSGGAFPGEGQGDNSIAIGRNAGGTNQNNYAIAIGYQAGETGQNAYSIAIGYQAGETGQHANTIVLNSNTSPLNTTQSDSFFVKPIRRVTDNTGLQQLYYDSLTGEIVYYVP